MNKEKELANSLPEKILKEFGIEVVRAGEVARLEMGEGTLEEHLSKLTGLLAVQAGLFEHALRISTALKPAEEGISAINFLRKQHLTFLNSIADRVLESYVDNEITAIKVEVNHE